MRGRSSATRRAVNPLVTRPRSRVWSGGSIHRNVSGKAAAGMVGCSCSASLSCPQSALCKILTQSVYRVARCNPMADMWSGPAARSSSYREYGSARFAGSNSSPNRGGTTMSVRVFAGLVATSISAPSHDSSALLRSPVVSVERTGGYADAHVGNGNRRTCQIVR